jgi:hypothetical protein
MRLSARLSLALSGLLVAVGAVLLIETALLGGGVGLLLGALFVLAGLGRIYLSRK